VRLIRTSVLALAAATLLVAAAEARKPSNLSGDTYTNVDGHRVRRPVHVLTPPTGWTARCRDGSYSFSEHHRGTCSRHGGVARWR